MMVSRHNEAPRTATNSRGADHRKRDLPMTNANDTTKTPAELKARYDALTEDQKSLPQGKLIASLLRLMGVVVL